VSFRARDRLEMTVFDLYCTKPALVRVLSTGWPIMILTLCSVLLSVVAARRDGRPRNRGSIPGMVKDFCHPKTFIPAVSPT
jgi:hypothetical protein